MEQTIPTWLDAAVRAAGITTTYNAEDWDRFAKIQTVSTKEFNDAANDPSAGPH